MSAITEVSETLQTAYEEQYTGLSEWRELGAKYKAENILAVCGDRKFAKAVEVGAGEGSILKALNGSNLASELYALEIADSGVAQIRSRNLTKLKEAKKFDGYTIPYPDKFFDLAYCSHVIEHVEHPRILLREIMRISEFQVFEIPLDYRRNVDQNVKHFLSYGHINVYTPSIFKFLLKSEGYEILSERFTKTNAEVIRYNWYRKMGLPKTFTNELKLRLYPVRNALRQAFHGRERYNEYACSAYTCLVRGVGKLKIY